MKMFSVTDILRQEIETFCVEIGADPLLVQGAGGNVSWKDGGVLWVKASGMVLGAARTRDVFLPVDLIALSGAVDAGQFDAKPVTLGAHSLRPSIETMLHALLPHKIVAHLHAVDMLAFLVRADDSDLHRLASVSGLRYGVVPYRKPGEELARALHGLDLKHIDVVFLSSHGVVVGADDVEQLRERLAKLVDLFAKDVAVRFDMPSAVPVERRGCFAPISDPRLHALATDRKLLNRVANDWALYPDHVVFLGPKGVIVPSVAQLDQVYEAPVVLVAGLGTYVSDRATQAQAEQLTCFFDVVTRIPSEIALRSLVQTEVAELLDWDAEKYRQAINS